MDTISAIATPAGKGGIAIIRISGPDAHTCLDRLFSKPNMEYRKLYFGTVKHNGTVLDKCLCVKFDENASYTGEKTAEIQCHGGYAAAREILSATLACGARLAESGEFTKRAFVNGKIDLSQAEAVSDMIEAETGAQLRAAARLLSGELGKKISAFQEKIKELLTLIEAGIDYPDEIDEDVTNERIKAEVTSMLDETEKLILGYSSGKLTKNGLKVCIIGKPNAGKSSLMNFLCGENRAIVTSTAGTTRDTLHEVLEISGVKVHLFDTAGIRESNDEIELAEIEKSQMTAEESDIILSISDASEYDDFSWTDFEKLKDKQGLFIFNKCDLNCGNKSKIPLEWKQVNVSIKENKGLENVVDFLKECAKESDCSSNLAITSERHLQALKCAHDELKQCLDCDTTDLMTIMLTSAWSALGLLTGETVTEDIVNNIFEKFCVGK